MSLSRILIADDHPLVADGVRNALQGHFEVVDWAINGRESVEKARALKPDVVVLDVSMPQLNGLEAARQIHSAQPAIKIVFLTGHTNPSYLRYALDSGALGYVLKTGVADELVRAVRTVLKGHQYVSPGFGNHVLETRFDSSGHATRAQNGLSSREMEVLQMLAEGHSNKEIAHALHISVKTVDFHRGNIMVKLGARSAAELIRIAIEQGLIVVAPP